MAHYRPSKRRRTKRNDRLHEDDVEALDAVTVERVVVDSKTGPIMKKTFVSISQAAQVDEEDDNPDHQDDHTEHQGVLFDDMGTFNDEMNQIDEPDDGVVPASKTKKA